MVSLKYELSSAGLNRAESMPTQASFKTTNDTRMMGKTHTAQRRTGFFSPQTQMMSTTQSSFNCLS